MVTSLAGDAGSAQPAADASQTKPEQQTIEDLRIALKNKLTPQSYRTLSGIITDWIGLRIARILRLKNPVSYWFSAALIAGLTLLVGMAISWARGEHLDSIQVEFSAWASVMGSLVLVANKIMIDIFLNTFRNSPVDTIESSQDLADLEDWLDWNFGYKWPLIFSVIFGPALGVFLLMQWNQAYGQKVLQFGPLFIAIIASFQAVVAIYYLFPFYLLLPSRLSRYRFNMFKADPSSSEVAKRLSDLFTLIMYITISYVILVTISFAHFKVLNSSTTLFLGIFVWAPTVALYIGCQFNLSKIITNSKWSMLNDVQTKIETLLTGTEIPTEETLEHLEKLMNYHDRIRNTPNSALDFRAVLNVLNSILLPLITLILANWSTIVALFTRAVSPAK